MTEERLKEIEARAAEGLTHTYRLYGGEVNPAWQVMKQDVPDLVAALREAWADLHDIKDDYTHEVIGREKENAAMRSLLTALVLDGPWCYDSDSDSDSIGQCVYCDGFDYTDGHEPDCPRLLAKQYLGLGEKEL